MGKMAESINSLGTGLVQGFGLLARALSQNQPQQSYPVHGIPFQPMPMAQFANNQQLDGQFGQGSLSASQFIPTNDTGNLYKL